MRQNFTKRSHARALRETRVAIPFQQMKNIREAHDKRVATIRSLSRTEQLPRPIIKAIIQNIHPYYSKRHKPAISATKGWVVMKDTWEFQRQLWRKHKISLEFGEFSDIVRQIKSGGVKTITVDAQLSGSVITKSMGVDTATGDVVHRVCLRQCPRKPFLVSANPKTGEPRNIWQPAVI